LTVHALAPSYPVIVSGNIEGWSVNKMRLASVRKDASPDTPGFVRLTGAVERESGEAFDIWYEVPSELEADLSESSNPWLVAMLPYALPNGETIVSDLPADATLLENLKGLIAVWCDWYPQYKPPTIRIPAAPLAAEEPFNPKSAAFFSGGVDSWFTVLRHAPERESAAIGRVDDLITVHGFDIPLDAQDEFAKLHATLAQGAQALGRKLIVARTNLRRNGSLWVKGWGWLTNGAGLASVALMLEKRYGKVLIGSSYPYGSLFPWGSHPMTDGLFSTRSLTVKQDGAPFTRTEKTALIARHAIALAHLHVCWKNGAASNCGICPKCIRTMATLQLLGAFEIANPFPVAFRQDRLAGLYIETGYEEAFIREIHALAAQTGHLPIQTAAAHALRRSRRLRPLVKLADNLGGVPVMWRFGPRIRQWCVN
jgi:hypothetical protein